MRGPARCWPAEIRVPSSMLACGEGTMPTGRNGRLIIANVDRLHRLMDAAGLAAVVVRGGQNVTYLSGVAFHGTLSRHLDLAASGRGGVVIWPRYPPPVFVLEVNAADAAEPYAC